METSAEWISSVPNQARHLISRLVRPTGIWIAFIGPDGCGKSAVISAIRQQFKLTYREVKCLHTRPKFLAGNRTTDSVVTDPHGKPPRGFLASIAKAGFLIADYTLGYLFRIMPALRRSNMIIFDRYIYDLLVDSKRARYGGPQWLLRMIASVVPRPDLVILLDASAEVLWSRKQEVPFEEILRQRKAYLDLARAMPSARIVNGAQSRANVIHDVDGVIIEHFAKREARRLRLRSSDGTGGDIERDASGQRC